MAASVTKAPLTSRRPLNLAHYSRKTVDGWEIGYSGIYGSKARNVASLGDREVGRLARGATQGRVAGRPWLVDTGKVGQGTEGKRLYDRRDEKSRVVVNGCWGRRRATSKGRRMTRSWAEIISAQQMLMGYFVVSIATNIGHVGLPLLTRL